MIAAGCLKPRVRSVATAVACVVTGVATLRVAQQSGRRFFNGLAIGG